MKQIIYKKNKSRSTNLGRFAGEWVALLNDKVIANSRGLNDLMAKIELKALRNKASVFLVPRKNENHYVMPLKEELVYAY
jgi:hypothetical protein